MLRWRALSGAMTLALLMGVAPLFRAIAAAPPHEPRKGSGPDATQSLEIYYSSPVLVRTGERVRMPVDVMCATAAGRACAATVTLGSRVGSEPWRLVSAPATAGLEFDLTASASRAAASSASGSVSFFIRAVDSRGRSTVLPPAGQADPLRFFVTRDLPIAKIPRLPFGRVRSGATALFLPWGSGSTRAGLELGRQSATIGPSGFDVDAQGRVYLLDSLQGRLAEFERGRSIAVAPLSVGPGAAMAVGADGHAFVGGRVGSSVGVSEVVASRTARTAELGTGMVSQIKVVAGKAYARVLPLDAWIAVPASTSGPHALPSAVGTSVGLPFAVGQELVRVGREDRLRIGRVLGDAVSEGLELTPPAGVQLGEVALAESDGQSGYWLVVRMAPKIAGRTDQYQVLHVKGTRVLSTFATASHSFAEAPPLSRFVLGKDGALYQMTSSPQGMRIVRYDLKEER